MLPQPLFMLLCSLFTFSNAGLLRNSHRKHQSGEQQLLLDPANFTAAHEPKSRSHFDAAPNSVGLLFTTSDSEEVEHVWLPLGKRAYTRDAPALPLHPLTARITTMIRSSPQKATPEYLDRVVCDIHPKYNRTMDNQNPEAMSISISRSDGLVRLDDDADVKAWKEIEWYECS